MQGGGGAPIEQINIFAPTLFEASYGPVHLDHILTTNKQLHVYLA